MADAKKVSVEITESKVIIPKSVHETAYVAEVADLGEVVEVYEDVAQKLEKDHKASRVTKDSPATIKKTLEETADAEKERRATLLTGDEEKEPKKKK